MAKTKKYRAEVARQRAEEDLQRDIDQPPFSYVDDDGDRHFITSYRLDYDVALAQAYAQGAEITFFDLHDRPFKTKADARASIRQHGDPDHQPTGSDDRDPLSIDGSVPSPGDRDSDEEYQPKPAAAAVAAKGGAGGGGGRKPSSDHARPEFSNDEESDGDDDDSDEDRGFRRHVKPKKKASASAAAASVKRGAASAAAKSAAPAGKGKAAAASAAVEAAGGLGAAAATASGAVAVKLRKPPAANHKQSEAASDTGAAAAKRGAAPAAAAAVAADGGAGGAGGAGGSGKGRDSKAAATAAVKVKALAAAQGTGKPAPKRRRPDDDDDSSDGGSDDDDAALDATDDAGDTDAPEEEDAAAGHGAMTFQEKLLYKEMAILRAKLMISSIQGMSNSEIKALAREPDNPDHWKAEIKRMKSHIEALQITIQHVLDDMEKEFDPDQKLPRDWISTAAKLKYAAKNLYKKFQVRWVCLMMMMMMCGCVALTRSLTFFFVAAETVQRPQCNWQQNGEGVAQLGSG
jgi:hypothetical protein